MRGHQQGAWWLYRIENKATAASASIIRRDDEAGAELVPPVRNVGLTGILCRTRRNNLRLRSRLGSDGAGILAGRLFVREAIVSIQHFLAHDDPEAATYWLRLKKIRGNY